MCIDHQRAKKGAKLALINAAQLRLLSIGL
jgi:hypothetical protein